MRAPKQTRETAKISARKVLLNYALAFAFGAVITDGVALLIAQNNTGAKSLNQGTGRHSQPGLPGHRTVAQLMALADAELEKVDIVEMSVAVAREIPGLEDLDYEHYKKIVDGWTDEFRRWMPAAEVSFRKSPQVWRNDINFFRLGLVATYLTRERGIRYDEKYSQEQKAGKNSKYEDPGAVLLHGLIDTLRGTCANMPVLHVVIGRRLGWPVSLASVGPHYVCRYDDGKVHYNIEATYTGLGFVCDSDEDYMKKDRLPRRAITSGSDFRSLSGREMLGVFVALRARYYWDTKQYDAADRDYVLARVLYPNHRYAYRESIRAFLWRGEQLFEPSETGHPAHLAGYLAYTYLRQTRRPPTVMRRPPYRPPMVYRNGPIADIDRINTINRANMLPQTPGVPHPGIQEPHRPHKPRIPGQPPR